MNLTEMYRGDTRILRLDADSNIAGGTLHMIIKTDPTDPDSQAIVNRPWDMGVAEPDGSVLYATFEIMPIESSQFPVGQVYVGIEYTTSAGRNYTIHAGPMNVLRDYRLAVG